MSEPPVSRPDGGDPGTVAGSTDPLGPTVILPAAGPPDASVAPSPPPSPEAQIPQLARVPQTALAQPASPVAGWYGKLPFLGDFASRRLPETFIRRWDEWLQPGLAASRQAKGERWLDLYLTFPVWRFLVPAGLIGEGCWIGVLLPSVDRVGRCFPLTICESLPRSLPEEAGLIAIDAHLEAMAQAGIESLEAPSVDTVEQKLAMLAPLNVVTGAVSAAASKRVALEAWLRQPSAGGGGAGAWPLNGSVAAALAAAASHFVVASLGDRVLWWSPADDAGGGALLLEPFPFSGRLLGNLIGAG